MTIVYGAALFHAGRHLPYRVEAGGRRAIVAPRADPGSARSRKPRRNGVYERFYTAIARIQTSTGDDSTPYGAVRRPSP